MNISWSIVNDPTQWEDNSSPMPTGVHEDNIMGMEPCRGGILITSYLGAFVFDPEDRSWECVLPGPLWLPELPKARPEPSQPDTGGV